MPLKFNPFTAQFDLTGSGGGGASYIDGEVQNFSALPQTVGSPAVDSAYLVRQAEGAWLLNRKPAGIYIRTANTGVRASDWTYAGEFPDVFNDANFLLYDNGDSTKNLAFQLSGITTGTTRTLTAPNASGTIARTEDFAAPPAIGNTTPAAGTFTTLNANNGTITASAPVLDLAQTWNNAAVTFVGANIDVTATNAGSSSRIFRVRLGGTEVFSVGRFGEISASVGYNTPGNIISSFGAISLTSGGGARLTSDATHVFAQRDGTNPQTFRLYNTTDAGLTNFERGFMRWSSNVLEIGSEAAGTGAARDVRLMRAGSAFIAAGATSVAASNQWVFGSTLFANGGISTTSSAVLVVNPQGNSTEFRGSAQSIRLFNARTSDTNFERLNLRWASNECIIDAEAGSGGGTLRGIKLGSATSSLLGFYGATPVDRPATVADPTGGGTVDAEARTAINDIIDRLQELGLIA